jgi:ATP-binding cassette subfamily B protein
MAEEKSLDWDLLKRILGLAKPYKSLFFFCGFLAVALAPVSILMPYLINIMVDDYIFNYDLQGLKLMAYIYIAVLLLHVFLQYLFVYLTSLLGQSIIRDLRVRVFMTLTRLRLSYFDKTPIGQSTTRTINDIETINTVFSQGVITIIADILSLVAVIIIMFITNWKLALLCMITLPLILIATYIFKEKVKVAYQKVRTEISNMNSFLNEHISGMRIVQIFNAERQEMNKFKKINRSYTQANLDSILYYAVFFPVVELISAIALAILVWWGAGAYLEGQVSFGALVAFPMYLSLMFRPMRMLADKFNTLQMGMVASERVFNVLDKQDYIQNTGKIQVEQFKGDVRFEDVSFAYVEEEYVLNNIDFHIKPGDTLAIVGSTGSGKSTIINILNRFYEIQKGRILIDGIDAREYELSSLRERIAIVLQDVFLFTGTIWENISLRNESISKEKILAASKSIGAHEFIENLPDQYDFKVMERGGNLSVGLRQLISFVRALVFDPDILILDEATSSIDTETEQVIQHAIETLIKKRSSIIIAHRLSTIRNADNIMVLSKGKVMEIGKHDELLAIEEGHYRKLYDMQFAAMAD